MNLCKKDWIASGSRPLNELDANTLILLDSHTRVILGKKRLIFRRKSLPFLAKNDTIGVSNKSSLISSPPTGWWVARKDDRGSRHCESLEETKQSRNEVHYLLLHQEGGWMLSL